VSVLTHAHTPKYGLLLDKSQRTKNYR
jgi:hypothetical protein